MGNHGPAVKSIAATRIRRLRPLSVAPFSQVLVRVTTRTYRPVQTDPNHSMDEHFHIRVINGVNDVKSGHPFDVLASSISTIQCGLLKEMLVSYVSQTRIKLVTMRNKGKKGSSPFSAFYYRKTKTTATILGHPLTRAPPGQEVNTTAQTPYHLP